MKFWMAHKYWLLVSSLMFTLYSTLELTYMCNGNLYKLIVFSFPTNAHFSSCSPFSGFSFLLLFQSPVPPLSGMTRPPGKSFLSPPSPSLMRTGRSFSISAFYRNLENRSLLLFPPLPGIGFLSPNYFFFKFQPKSSPTSNVDQVGIDWMASGWLV